MTERKYSVVEIDRMRAALTVLLSSRFPMQGVDTEGRTVSVYRLEPPSAVVVEERLRTYMLNGTDPEELEDLEKG